MNSGKSLGTEVHRPGIGGSTDQYILVPVFGDRGFAFGDNKEKPPGGIPPGA